MDIEKLFLNIESLEHYINITKDVSRKYKNTKIQLNMSTVISLKKARFFEVEYFTECDGHGAAIIIIERLLEVGRSKIWGLLGKELVLLFQHWLDSTRKQLIIMTKNWWSFMKLLLKFIKELRLKDSVLPDMLVEGTAEYLLDLATRSQVNVQQRLDILYCLNLCCADSSREVRFSTRHRLETYFVKLSTILATTGHVPTQYYILETLLRWLLPRQNTSVRQTAASMWFPENLYRKEAVGVFLERKWQNFYLDARDFLNAHNQSPGLPTSVAYRQITIGTLIMECSTKRDAWLDINPATKSITILLEPRMTEVLKLPAATMHTLVVDSDIVTCVKLGRESSELTLVIKTMRPLHTYPSDQPIGDGDITIAVSQRNDLRRFDNALRDVFGDLYEILIDFEELSSSSPHKADGNKKIVSSSEEDTRFSHPVRTTRRKFSGYVTKSASTWKSPSTTSTTSLALLHDRLEALPKFRFNKEPVKVAALPDLSMVSELTEVIDTQSIASGTSSNRPYRGGFKTLRKTEKKSQSDGETSVSKKYISPISGVKEHNPSCLLVATVGADESILNDTIQSLSKNKDYESDNIVDLLLKEALQSKDDKLDSGINTCENRKSPELRDSDAIEDTPNLEQPKSFRKKVTVPKDNESECNEIDVSQFEFVSVRKKVLIDKHKEIEDDVQNGIDTNDMPTFDEDAIEKFFSEHITQDRTGGIVLSPTLARKINETSSEDSNSFKDCLVEGDFCNAQNLQVNFVDINYIQDAEVIDCLNNIIDKVCHDIEKCTEILGMDHIRMDSSNVMEIKEVENRDDNVNRVLVNIENLDSYNKKVVETPKKKPKQKKVIKLKFNTKKTRSKRQNNLASKMSPIPESKDSVDPEMLEKNKPHISIEKAICPEVSEPTDNILIEVAQVPNEKAATSPEITNISPKSIDSNAPLIRRRRKLYSPKDEHNKTDNSNENTEKQESDVHYLQDDDEADFKSVSKNTPKYAATCYKDIEKTRNKLIRLPKSRKNKKQTRSQSPKSKKVHSFDNLNSRVDVILAKKRSPSPRTKKMNDLFDNLKTNVEEHDVIFADNKFNEEELAVYNFTSDSEDEDFKKKKVELKKRFSTTTNASCDSIISRHGRVVNKVNYSERSSDDKPKKAKANEKTKKNVVRRKKVSQRRPYNLADERMREAQNEKLNTSLVINKTDNEVLTEPDLVLEAPPQMEVMGSEIDETVTTASRPNKSGKKKKKITVKKDAKLKIDRKNDNDDKTLSPLPGLVIEAMPSRNEDPNDSVCTQVMNKLKKIYHDGPDIVDESNTTQNMLLDIDKDFSHHSISNDFGRMSPNISDIKQTNSKHIITRKNNAILTENENVIEEISFEEITENVRRRKGGDIVNISDVQSEKSIATVGKSPINAHGNIDEAPPDKILLLKRVQSRDLTIDDMDTSIKDYYLKLKEQLNQPNSSENSSGILEIDLKGADNNSQFASPVAQRLERSNDVFRGPIRKSDGRCGGKIDLIENFSEKVVSPDAKASKCKLNIFDKIKMDLIEESSNSSRKCISPVVSLTKMSYDDISRWLPSRRNSSDSSNSQISKPIEKIKDVSEKSFLRPISSVNAKDIRSVPQNTSQEVSLSSKSSSKGNKTKKGIRLQYNLRSASKTISSITKIETDIDGNNNDHNSITARKSIISPIKLLDELEAFITPQITEKENTITEPIGLEERGKNPVLNISVSSKRLKKSAGISSGESNISSSTRVDGRVSIRGAKRKSDTPERVYGKKGKMEVITESGPSMSSVDDWLKKSAPTIAGKNLDDSYAETVQNIMEKLDTTLAEIHQNTSKNFLHLFVEAQRHLALAKHERRRALKQVATDVLKEVVNVLDRKFDDLEKRNQEMDTEFMEQLKSRAAEFIREDCKKKRVMVALLREDINATVHRIHSQDTE
ncbi:uncharacterized protein LOC128679822 [Plodia interpunctella]|uniref:uncharacterized protein LOC128679822 n=1 Tax=Plodia interpunctella TaxID=58824 RepID=UPI002367BF1B|nr:uncharacterized protein LOC128679822 [Plodia interpunctella]